MNNYYCSELTVYIMQLKELIIKAIIKDIIKDIIPFLFLTGCILYMLLN
jgi:hypothetical protein